MRYTFPPIDTVMQGYQTNNTVPITDEDGSTHQLRVRLLCAPNGGSSRWLLGSIEGQAVAGLLKVSGTGVLREVMVSLDERKLILTAADLATLQRQPV